MDPRTFEKHVRTIQKQNRQKRRLSVGKFGLCRFIFCLLAFLAFLSRALWGYVLGWVLLGIGSLGLAFFFSCMKQMQAAPSAPPRNTYGVMDTGMAMNHYEATSKALLSFLLQMLLLIALVLLAIFLPEGMHFNFVRTLAIVSGVFTFGCLISIR